MPRRCDSPIHPGKYRCTYLGCIARLLIVGWLELDGDTAQNARSSDIAVH